MIKPQKLSRKVNIQYLPFEGKQIAWMISWMKWCKERGSSLWVIETMYCLKLLGKHECGMYFSRHTYSKEVHTILTNQPPFPLHPAELCLCLPSFPLFFFFNITNNHKKKKKSVSWLHITVLQPFCREETEWGRDKQMWHGLCDCGFCFHKP